MRILQVMAGAPQGGAETAFVDMCLALHEAGQKIEVVTRANNLRVSQMEGAGIKVHTLPFGGVPDIYTKWKLGRIIRAFKPNIVQTWMSRAAQKTPRWRAGMNIPRYLVVSRLGGYYALKHFRETDYFTTITPDIRRFLIDEGVDAGRITHINNFAEMELNAKPVPRHIFQTPDDAKLFLALGRLHKAKAFDILLQAMADVPDAHLWIAGEGPDRETLLKLCADLGLNDRVKFLGWRDDRGALFAAADFCVFPSRYEPFGTVFVQAWSQKKPLVVTASDGPRQYVRDGDDSLLVPVDDASALAGAMRALCQDPALGQRLAERGYQRYVSEFTKENTVRSYTALYGEILRQEGIAL